MESSGGARDQGTILGSCLGQKAVTWSNLLFGLVGPAQSSPEAEQRSPEVLQGAERPRIGPVSMAAGSLPTLDLVSGLWGRYSCFVRMPAQNWSSPSEEGLTGQGEDHRIHLANIQGHPPGFLETPFPFFGEVVLGGRGWSMDKDLL